MKPNSQSVVALLALSALMLTGCGHLPAVPPPLATKIIDRCQRLAKPVAPPAISEDSDYRKLAAESLQAIDKANGRLSAVSRCEAALTRDLSGGGE